MILLKMMLLAVVAVVLSSLVATAFGATKPGFKARITQGALDYANQQAIDALAKKASSASIPDQSGSSGVFDYQISNIHLTGLSKPNSQITIVPGTGLSWTGTNAGVSLNADWQVQTRGWIPISFSGSVDASVSGTNFGTTMVLGVDPSGRPSISCGSCSCSVGDVNIDIYGDLDFLLNLFKGMIEDKISDAIPGAVCSGVTEAINIKAEEQLQNLKVTTLLLDDKFRLDYRFVLTPAFQPPYMETFHQGEMTWAKNPKTPPFSPLPLPDYPSTDRMLYLWVGQYVPESFLYAAQVNGFLQYSVNPSDLPQDQRVFLNTTCTGICIGNVIPAIGQKYPNSIVELRMNSTSVPKVVISPGDLEASFTGDIALYAHTPQGVVPYLLTLNVSAIFNMTVTVSNQLIKGNISGSSFQVGVLDSAVGPIQGNINLMMNFVLKRFIIPKLNEKGNSGFPLPVTGDISFTNTQLQIQQNALMVATDLLYTPH